MTFLLSIVIVVFLDRVAPVAILRYDRRYANIDLKALYQRYGAVRLPRTMFGGLACAFAALDAAWPQGGLFGIGVACCLVLLFVFAGVDARRAVNWRQPS
jgi:hypothetical protein